jgi:SAM-dependent methyltransferase
MMRRAMAASPAFAPLARGLRDEVIEHFERRGEPLDTPAALLTLDTNSVLAADRGRLLLRVLAARGCGPIRGQRVLDMGAGFGSLALYFAHLGAETVAVDPNEERMRVALAVAEREGLTLRAVCAHAQSLPLTDESFDVIIANNSLCYIADRRERRDALSELHRVLRPDGWIVVRNPNRLHPRDPFTGLPLVGLMPPSLAKRTVGALHRHRSEVRLCSPWGAVRELRRAGFDGARWSPQRPRALGAGLESYHHVAAQRKRR